MPPKRAKLANGRAGARADVGAILEFTDFLPRFLAGGLVAWLLAAEPASNQRARGAVVATMRILCKDLREAVNKELTELMQRLVELIASARECSTKLRNRERVGDEEGIKLEKASLEAALARVEKTTVPCFGSCCAMQIRTDIVEFSGMTARLMAHHGTFLAMAQQRCQLSLRQPNVCSVSHLVSNFTQLRTPEAGLVCVYARPKGRDSMLIYRTQFLQNAGRPGERDTFDLARAMLRMRDVYFPCTNGEILSAFGGRLSGTPAELFVEKHPHFDPLLSVEGLLGLTPHETARAKASVSFSRQQEQERKRKIAQIERAHMAQAVDEFIRDSKSLPGIRSLEELGKACPGMEKCVRVMVSKLHLGHLSPVDSGPVRHALKTAGAFLRDVAAAQKKLSGGVSSGEAYDFASGMHVGHYSELSTAGQDMTWPRWHAGLYLCVVSFRLAGCSPLVPENFRGLDAAMRFFDALGGAKLERAAQTPKGMVPRYRLSAGGETVEFEANWVSSWESCKEMQLGVQRLVRDSGLDPANWSVPPLSKEDYTSYQRLRAANTMEYINPHFKIAPGKQSIYEAASGPRYVTWTEDVFAMLAAEPATRCGALSVAGLQTGMLLSEFSSRAALR